MTDERDAGEVPFLSRWSRRKVAARAQEERQPLATAVPSIAPAELHEARADEPVGAATIEPMPSREPKALPPVDSLQGLASEYRDFMTSDVEESTRRAALKKLFADPHFNQMDGLDTYIDDYSKPDPLSPAIAASLAAAKRLVVDRALDFAPPQDAEKSASEATQRVDSRAPQAEADAPLPTPEVPNAAPDLPQPQAAAPQPASEPNESAAKNDAAGPHPAP